MGLLDLFHRHQPTGPIVTVRFDAAGRFLAWADRDGQIQVQELARRRPRTLTSPHAPLTGLWFDPHRDLLLAGYQSGRVAVFDPATGKLIREVACKAESNRRILSGTSRPVLDWVVAILFPPAGTTFRVVLEAGEVVTVNRERFEVVEGTEPFGNLTDCAAPRPDGSEVFLGDDLGYVYKLGPDDSSRSIVCRHSERLPAFDTAGRSSMVDHAAGIAAVAVAADRALIASTSREGGIQAWDLDSFDNIVNVEKRQPLRAREPIGRTWIRGLGFVPGRPALVWGDDTGRIDLWDFETGSDQTLARLDEGVQSLAVAPDGTEVAVGGERGTLKRVNLPRLT